MDLQITVFLLFVLFTAGHSFSCYQCSGILGDCRGQTVATCPSGLSKCLSATTATLIGGASTKIMAKDCVADCANGSMSHSTAKMSTVCCDTDQCNVQDAPDASNVPNGKKCYSCDGTSCSNIISCSGSEDRCFKATVTYKDVKADIKGCFSNSLCNRPNLIPSVSDVSCCEGNLCNGAQSVTHSFQFLCCSLLSFVLLH
ncbi:hypothetical protein QQF64_018158 [Cirrhinus molitorella]|uniref:UPAR/Ly6 domain-containing protein n=2 Tax=Cirrhinus molitorella TaxID=172907 RepID=A0AA88P7G6_9TELE|nr:hypothetical protein Q8A67_022156 [Cirrhinus molitorella]